MPYCSNCGKEVEPGAKFCSNCGAPQTQFKATDMQARVEESDAKGRVRPPRIGIITAADFVVGFIVMVLGLLILATPSNSPSFVLFLLGFGTLVIILGGLSVAVGYGLRTAKPWAWLLGLWAGAVYMVLGLLILMGSALFGVGSLVFGGISIYYLTRKEARDYLGKTRRLA